MSDTIAVFDVVVVVVSVTIAVPWAEARREPPEDPGPF